MNQIGLRLCTLGMHLIRAILFENCWNDKSVGKEAIFWESLQV